jgi:hypothetical protein
MNPQPTFWQTLHMLWTGQGLANLLPWLPAGARAALAVWLPVAFKVAIGLIVTALVYRLFLSQPRDRGRHLRGSRLVIHRWAALRKRLALDQHRLRIGGVAFPRKLESLHLLITGATGAGKSQTIQGTLDAIRGRGDGAILTDIGSEALKGFGQTGDWILNPLDARSVPWSPFADSRRFARRRQADLVAESRESRIFLVAQNEWVVEKRLNSRIAAAPCPIEPFEGFLRIASQRVHFSDLKRGYARILLKQRLECRVGHTPIRANLACKGDPYVVPRSWRFLLGSRECRLRVAALDLDDRERTVIGFRARLQLDSLADRALCLIKAIQS